MKEAIDLGQWQPTAIVFLLSLRLGRMRQRIKTETEDGAIDGAQLSLAYG